MEIYNEEINDLLVPEHRKLRIHENLEVLNFLSINCCNSLLVIESTFVVTSYLQRGIYVAGLREEIVASPEQVLRFMEFGECKFMYFFPLLFVACVVYMCNQSQRICNLHLNSRLIPKFIFFLFIYGFFSLYT